MVGHITDTGGRGVGERHRRLGGLGRQGQDRRGKAGRCKAEAEQRETGT